MMEKAFDLSPLGMLLVLVCLYVASPFLSLSFSIPSLVFSALYQNEEVPYSSVLGLVNAFSMTGYWILSMVLLFFSKYRNDYMVFVF